MKSTSSVNNTCYAPESYFVQYNIQPDAHNKWQKN